MSLTNETPRTSPLQGNSATTVWNFDFLIPSDGSGDALAVVYLYNSVNYAITVLDASTYSFANLDVEAGGSLTYPLTGSPISSDYYIVIARALPYDQPTVVTNQGFYPHTVEDVADYIVEQTQQLADAVNRGIKASVVDSGVTDLPVAATLVDRLFYMGPDGKTPTAFPLTVAELLAAISTSRVVDGVPFFAPEGYGAADTFVDAVDDVPFIQAAINAAYAYYLGTGAQAIVDLSRRTYSIGSSPNYVSVAASGSNFFVCLLDKPGVSYKWGPNTWWRIANGFGAIGFDWLMVLNQNTATAVYSKNFLDPGLDWNPENNNNCIGLNRCLTGASFTGTFTPGDTVTDGTHTATVVHWRADQKVLTVDPTTDTSPSGATVTGPHGVLSTVTARGFKAKGVQCLPGSNARFTTQRLRLRGNSGSTAWFIGSGGGQVACEEYILQNWLLGSYAENNMKGAGRVYQDNSTIHIHGGTKSSIIMDNMVFKDSATEVSLTGTVTNGSAVITGLASTANLVAGYTPMFVAGPTAGHYFDTPTGGVGGTYIVSIDSSTQITVSKNAKDSGTIALTFCQITSNNPYECHTANIAYIGDCEIDGYFSQGILSNTTTGNAKAIYYGKHLGWNVGTNLHIDNGGGDAVPPLTAGIQALTFGNIESHIRFSRHYPSQGNFVSGCTQNVLEHAAAVPGGILTYNWVYAEWITSPLDFGESGGVSAAVTQQVETNAAYSQYWDVIRIVSGGARKAPGAGISLKTFAGTAGPKSIDIGNFIGYNVKGTVVDINSDSLANFHFGTIRGVDDQGTGTITNIVAVRSLQSTATGLIENTSASYADGATHTPFTFTGAGAVNVKILSHKQDGVTLAAPYTSGIACAIGSKIEVTGSAPGVYTRYATAAITNWVFAPDVNVPLAVASLPAAANCKGSRVTVTDANTTLTLGIGTTITAGGGNIVPGFCDGTNWVYG